MSTLQQVRKIRGDIATLSTLANNDLTIIWRSVTTAVDARDALADVLPSIVEAYGSAAATVAADWYDDLRDESGVAGRFRAIPAVVGESGAESLAGWGTGPLYGAEPNWDTARSLIAGGLQRRIANAARSTITGSSLADPRAAGWQRVTDGNGCAFCVMLTARGTVYSKDSADFASHDDCGCQAAPAFLGRPVPVRAYTPSTRRISDADRARVRAYIRDNL